MAREAGADLLVSGALKQETFSKYYFGSIARKLARQDVLPILLIPEPNLNPKPIKKLIISINPDSSLKVLERGLQFARLFKAEKIFIAKESNIKGSKHLLNRYYSEEQSQIIQQELEDQEQEYIFQLLSKFDTVGLDIGIKILFGHSGVSLMHYATQIGADMLIDAYPKFKLGFWDRLFPRNIEYALLNLPCKLLLIN